MSNADNVKGRAKEATGALTGDEDLKREGRADQATGQAKEAVDKATDKVQEAGDKLKDKIDRD